MNEDCFARGQLNDITVSNFYQNSNEIEEINGTYTSNFQPQFKCTQELLSEGSSNCIFPRVNSDININCHNFDTFITDKVKETPRKFDNNEKDGDFPNLLKPSFFDQIEMKSNKKFASKGTYSPKFHYKDENLMKITKYNNIPWEFHTMVPFPINGNDNYMKYIKEELGKVKDKQFLMSKHYSLNPTNFVNCFNKSINDKLAYNTDIKKLVYNCSKNDYEHKVKLIKNMIKTEMVNRSCGQGVFNCNNRLREQANNIKRYQNAQLKKENENNPLLINLKRKEYFDKKPLDNSGEIYFNRKFLRHSYDNYKAEKTAKTIEKNKTREFNNQINRLYNMEVRKKKVDFNSQRDRKVINAIKSAQLDGYILDKGANFSMKSVNRPNLS